MLTRYEQASVADLAPPLNAWEWHGGRGLLLYGPRGTGKTHAAVALWKQYRSQLALADQLVQVPFVSVARLMQEKRRKMDRPASEANAGWQEPDWKRVPMVVFDDWDKCRITEWVREELFTIIDTLYCRMVPIIVTSNLTPREFALHSGEFITDRIKEMCVPVPMTGQSRRRTPDVSDMRADHAPRGHGQLPPAARPDARPDLEPELGAEPDGAFTSGGAAEAGLGRDGGAAEDPRQPEAGRDVPAGHAAVSMA